MPVEAPKLAISTQFISKTTPEVVAYRALADSQTGIVPMHHHDMQGERVFEPEYIRSLAAEVHGMGFSGDLAPKHEHGSHGKQAAWSTDESRRLGVGIPVVRSRIDMAAALGGEGSVVTFHPMGLHGTPEEVEARFNAHRRTLDFMTQYAGEKGVLIAVENLHWPEFENHGMILRLLREYGPDVLGVSIDTGHLNLGPDAMEFAEAVADRTVALHLNDNTGEVDNSTVDGAREGDRHLNLYDGTFDFHRFARLIAPAPYFGLKSGQVSMEIGIRAEEATPDQIQDFIKVSEGKGRRFLEEVELYRASA